MNIILAPEKTSLKYFLLFFFLVFFAQSHSQVVRDSVTRSSVQELIADHPYFNFDGPPVDLAIDERTPETNEGLFYLVIGLVLFLALMRLIFYKYFTTMFTLFFRATLRQQQLREQMLQARLPSLLMNIFFVVSFALYCVLLGRYYQLPVASDFTKAMLSAIALIAIIYTGKFLVLNIVGWIFGIRNATDTYLFIVFLVNKMIGLFLIPFIILLAFPTSGLLPTVLTLSFVMVAAMFLYRFIVSYRPVRGEIKLSRLQFFLYLCAFEIAPLLLIYKVLLTFEVSRL